MTDNQNIAIKAAAYYAGNAGLLCCNRLFAVLDAHTNDMGMYLVRANGSDFAAVAQRLLPCMGVDPVTRSIAEKIVKTVNLNAHIIPLDNASQINAEICRHYALAAKVIAFMEKNPDKESLKLNTNFECAPDQKHPVAISIPEVREMSAKYARQYVPVFNEFLAAQNTRVIDLEKIILVGDTFMKAGIAQEFLQMGESDFVFYSSADSMSIQNYEIPAVPDDEATAILPQEPPATPPVTPPEPPAPPVTPPAPPEPEFITSYKPVERLSVSNIPVGTWVRLDTFDSTPGKGAAYQELEYIGDGLFKVISSGRSLAPGDIAKPYAGTWQKEVQLDLEITRGATSLGRFRTRVVKKISIKNCYEVSIA